MKKVLICGTGGFIAPHPVRRPKKGGPWVRGTDFKYPEVSRKGLAVTIC
jgi:hypothetical protein